MMSIFFRVQVCCADGGDVSHEDFCTYDEAMSYYNNCEVNFGDVCELYKMAEIDNHIHLVDVIKG